MKTMTATTLIVITMLGSTGSNIHAQTVITPPAEGIMLVNGATYPSGTVYANGRAYPPGMTITGGQTFDMLTLGFGARPMPLPGIVTSGDTYSPTMFNNGVYGAGYNTRVGGGIFSAGYLSGNGWNTGYPGNWNNGFSNNWNNGGYRGYYGSGFNTGYPNYSGNRGMVYTGGGRGRGGRGR